MAGVSPDDSWGATTEGGQRKQVQVKAGGVETGE